MRFIFRWAFRILLLAVVLLVALVLLKDTLLKSYAELKLRKETGLEVRIGKFQWGLLSPTFTMELRIYNPAEFGGAPFLDLPELHVEWDPRALASRELRLKLVRVHLLEMNIVENRAGHTNVTGMLERLEPLLSTNSPQTVLPMLPFGGIDVVNLTLGKVRYSSLRSPGKMTEVELGIRNELLTDINSFDQFSQLLLTRMLQKGVTIASPAYSSSFVEPAVPHGRKRK